MQSLPLVGCGLKIVFREAMFYRMTLFWENMSYRRTFLMGGHFLLLEVGWGGVGGGYSRMEEGLIVTLFNAFSGIFSLYSATMKRDQK